MKSALILVAAAAVFTVFMARTLDKADTLLANEAQALAILKERVASDDRQPHEEAGYRFAWEGGGDLPEVCVARPIRHGEDGVRHFAAVPGGAIYEFDTVLVRAPANRPAVRPLLLYLALSEGEREEVPPLFGWREVQ